MKITALSTQVRNRSRINVAIDGAYAFSLDVTQIVDLGLRVGLELDEVTLAGLRQEGAFGKLYTRTLEYVLMRPRSSRELRDYLYRKTRDTRTRSGAVREGYSSKVTERVFDTLLEKGYVDDKKFAYYWVENRHTRRGSSVRKLKSELFSKGVDAEIIDEVLGTTDRTDQDELQKVIAKKSSKYTDTDKLAAYLVRQGFRYDDVKRALEG